MSKHSQTSHDASTILARALSKTITPFFQDDSTVLLLGDTFKLLPRIKTGVIDMIFADPPYFLSNDGITCKSGKMVSVNKASWDEGMSATQRHIFNRRWIRLCKRILSDNGTIWVSGTLHNIYSIGMALEQEGFKILNNITWQKSNPPPNLACRCFTHSTETILWAKKKDKTAKHFFDYDLMKKMNEGKQMKDVWTGSLIRKNEKRYGKHPTQKPEYILERIVLSSSRKGNLILDPFSGSGTTGVVAKKYNRSFIGIDNVVEYIEIAKKRLEDLKDGS